MYNINDVMRSDVIVYLLSNDEPEIILAHLGLKT